MSKENGCVVYGLGSYQFSPEDKPDLKLSGFTIWLGEEGLKGYIGAKPVKVSYSTKRFDEFLSKYGYLSADMLVGERFEIVYNKYGRAELFKV